MNKKRQKKKKTGRRSFFNLPMILGILCFIAAGVFVYRNYLISVEVGETSRQVLGQVQEQMEILQNASAADGESGSSVDENASETDSGNSEVEGYVPDPDEEVPVLEVDGKDYIGILNIPTLDLYLPILAEFEQENLETAPAVYDGNLYQDSALIAAHNYSTHFGNLKSLSIGDAINVTDVNGHEFRYEVILIEDMNRTEVARMYGGDWDLTLFTCVPNTYNRKAVRCRRVYPTYPSRHVTE